MKENTISASSLTNLRTLELIIQKSKYGIWTYDLIFQGLDTCSECFNHLCPPGYWMFPVLSINIPYMYLKSDYYFHGSMIFNLLFWCLWPTCCLGSSRFALRCSGPEGFSSALSCIRQVHIRQVRLCDLQREIIKHVLYIRVSTTTTGKNRYQIADCHFYRGINPCKITVMRYDTFQIKHGLYLIKTDSNKPLAQSTRLSVSYLRKEYILISRVSILIYSDL